MYCNATYVKSDVDIIAGKYPNRRLALTLIDIYDGTPAAKVTVNVPECPLEKDAIIVKSYSENEGMLEWLVKSGLVESTGKPVIVGREIAEIVKVTDKLKAMIGISPTNQITP